MLEAHAKAPPPGVSATIGIAAASVNSAMQIFGSMLCTHGYYIKIKRRRSLCPTNTSDVAYIPCLSVSPSGQIKHREIVDLQMFTQCFD
jgi:hypothetical protein